MVRCHSMSHIILRCLMGGTILSGAVAPVAAQTNGAKSDAVRFDIAAQPLEQALRLFMRQSGVQTSWSGINIAMLKGQGVKGQMPAAAALSRLLEGTGLSWRFTGATSVVLERGPDFAADDNSVRLGTLRVEGSGGSGGAGGMISGNNGRVAGWDGTSASVYSTPGSVSVITKETLESYPAQSPADMLRGATGIVSGEARTSGGLDVNIRGLQGQGRVPVTVDGAINGTTVYRGYQGTSNRSFVDPDFISHIAIEKGPSMGNAIAGGIGGSVTMSTIGVDDIVPEGDTMGIRLKGSLSNNSTSPGSNMTRTLIEPKRSAGDTLLATQERNRPGFFSPTGGSGSLVFARKGDVIDLLAGYSFRRTGNYHAGENGKYAPKATGTPSDYCASVLGGTSEMAVLCGRAVEYYDKHGSTPFAGGEEVYNTSTDTESVIAKAVIRPADDHVLELGYGGYWSIFGENYPGALGSATATVYQNSILSKTSLNRYTARYRWNPEGDLVDLKLNGWLSNMKEKAPSLANSDPSRRYVDSWGTDLTNSSRVLTPLGLFSADYGASYIHEKAGPVGTWVMTGSIPPGREGTRSEYSIFAQTALEPAPWLRLAAGGRYQDYTIKDRQSGTTYHTEIFNRGEDAFSFSLGATVMPVEGVQLFANYKQAARLPSLMEATTGFFMIANPDLHKEEAHNWELGANYNQTGLLSDADELGMKLVWFDNMIDGYISRRYISQYYAMQMFNIDKAKFRGLEGNISYKIGGFSMDAGATYYDRIQFCRTEGTACIESSLASDYATNYIPARWSANVSLSQKFLNDRAMLGARLTYMGKRAAGAEKPQSGYMPLINAIEWHPYVLVDMNGRYKLNDALSIDWSVDNLFDRYYNEAMSLGYVPAPGRTFRIGFTGTIGSKNGIWPGKWFTGSGNADPVNWTGLYVGADMGYGMGKTSGIVTDSAGNAADIGNGSRYSETMRNAIGGLHAGFNYQFPNNVVIGAEADINAGDLGNWSGVIISDESNYTSYLVSNGRLESDTRYKWDRMISLRGKLGYSMGRTLVYGTAGLGWLRETQTRNQYRSSGSGDQGVSNSIEHYFTEKAQHTRRGIVLGGGVERAIGKRWSLRADYSYAHFGRKGFSFDQARAGVAQDYSYWETVGYKDMPGYTITLPNGTVWEIPPYQQPIREIRDVTGTSNITNGRVNRGDADLHMIRLGISYRF